MARSSHLEDGGAAAGKAEEELCVVGLRRRSRSKSRRQKRRRTSESDGFQKLSTDTWTESGTEAPRGGAAPTLEETVRSFSREGFVFLKPRSEHVRTDEAVKHDPDTLTETLYCVFHCVGTEI
ncbi:unnamed protein product [Pleuronectes platessa]|uniref:Uncharacterized protein n=1 Tax=Pleuronectes platessa TaxID=8262 RepID=A0A9N7UQ10_PLEPL|nr:unnamed protein product [Pleuronectes platessa]